jgi:TolB protein
MEATAFRTIGRAAALGLAAAGALAGAGFEGEEIAFLTRRDGDWEVYLRCADGRELNLTSHPASDYGFSWSPDGARLAFSTDRDGNREIYALELATGRLENLTRHPAEDVQPDWSPDGRHLAFVSDRVATAPDPANRADLWRLELASGATLRLTRNELYEESPDWSPDGERLAFSRIVPAGAGGAEGGDGDAELFEIGGDASGERRLLARPGFDSGASWTPDGGRILFHGRAARSMEILELDLATGAVRPLTDDDRDDWQPRSSPDGAEIAWCTGERGKALDLWIMSRSGGDARRFVEHPARDEAPEARPAGARGGPCAAAPAS